MFRSIGNRSHDWIHGSGYLKVGSVMNMCTNHQLSSVHSNFQCYVCVCHFPHSLAAWNESPLPAYHPTVLADTDTYLETLIELALIRSHMIKSFVFICHRWLEKSNTFYQHSSYGDGSIPIDTFLVGWTSIYQLFWGSLGTRVLTHCHMSDYR